MAIQPTTGILNRMFLRKTVEQVQRETEKSELKRTLGAWNLVFLGIGCIIGAGIFVRTGSAASLHAGPAVLISFLIAGVVCALAGLCYAELSSTLPVSGSAYTYSYTTLGEFAAWIMGALLLLEYGLAASVVAVGWAGYVVSLLGDFGMVIPVALTGPSGYPVMHAVGNDMVPVLVNGAPVTYLFNLPAFLICMAMTALLVVGVSESAKVNNAIVAIKLTVIIAFILICGGYVIAHIDTLKANWVPFIPRMKAMANSVGAASRAPLRSYSSLTSVSKRSRPPDRKPKTRKRTCRSGCWVRLRSARSSTSSCRS